MQDRVSLYPGRVKLVPVAGQENTYDMVRADSPTQEGTPLSKESFLKDATAALYGLDETAVPDDVLVLLKTLVSNAQTSADGKTSIATGYYVGTGKYGASNKNSLTFDSPVKMMIAYKTDGPWCYDTYGWRGSFFWMENTYNLQIYGDTHSGTVFFEKSNDGKTVSWYSGSYADVQLNTSGKTYYYMAFL